MYWKLIKLTVQRGYFVGRDEANGTNSTHCRSCRKFMYYSLAELFQFKLFIFFVYDYKFCNFLFFFDERNIEKNISFAKINDLARNYFPSMKNKLTNTGCIKGTISLNEKNFFNTVSYFFFFCTLLFILELLLLWMIIHSWKEIIIWKI